ncbi:Hypothetical predicted protein [Paramuricea clavata]|uniref:SUZ domain-containing protein n=1 Tax=Paramuricea clavata TaxID=317549 RepID=A0A7D9IZW9_PARCT|nr:Hypothetical predicted protein [Paramuricea clavata]
MEGKKSKSIEEREEEYKKARSRIFNHGSLSSQSSASSKDGESILPGFTDVDSENEKSRSIEYSESVGDATVDMPQPAVRVLTNRSRSPDDLPKLALEVGSNMDASSSASSATLPTIGTDWNLDSSVLTRSVDTTTASIEGIPYITRNIPGTDGAGRANMVEMIPQLSPNQTGGVVWTLPENQATYPPGQGPIFPAHEAAGGQMVGPDSFQPSAVGMQQGVAPTFFFPNQPTPAGPTYQGQPAPRQPTPPLQQSQGGFPSQILPVAAQFVNPATFFPRIYNQQDLEMLPTQQNNVPANAQGVMTPNTGSPSSNYQELNSQFTGMSISPAEQQENPGLTKQRGGSAFPPSSTQQFPSGQPLQFVVYRNISGAMVATPVSNHGQVNPAYVYPSPTPHAYTQQGYNAQVFNQVYPQQHFNQGFALGEQTLLTQRSGSHTPPPQSGPPLNTNPGFIQHVQAMPVTPSRPQVPTQVLNPGMLHARLMNPYGVQGQQVVHIPAGQQLFGYTQVPYGQNRPNLQQPPRYKPYAEKGNHKSNDVYIPESSNLRRPSPSDSPRGNTSSGQNRRSSGGSGKGHGKSDVQR